MCLKPLGRCLPVRSWVLTARGSIKCWRNKLTDRKTVPEEHARGISIPVVLSDCLRQKHRIIIIHLLNVLPHCLSQPLSYSSGNMQKVKGGHCVHSNNYNPTNSYLWYWLKVLTSYLNVHCGKCQLATVIVS